MTVINMIKSDAGEAMHLFEVMQKHGVKCSLEMKHGNADPMVSIASAAVQTEYVKGSDNDTVVVSLNDVNLAFPLGEYSYSKFISDIQIDIAIASESHTAWFSSKAMSLEAIAEAKAYVDLAHSLIVLDKHEQALIAYLRELSFDDLLDANMALLDESDRAQREAIQKQTTTDRREADGFRERAGNLRELAELLGLANTDYRAHIEATESETNDAGK
ncbi:hypothetical protein FHS16_001750 [Paenibacillus endophyticus]|uniref:Uncharacterized protein n=1 Tax=Paenibacillus endophyticus TaxID=1294268 RepID=A0A7W5G932_9BACL|nr:hypothetical protein [Paenibacillus endophyticus]MBB3151704.1 hypothetical protein [Paenibacillus endophyticus]